MKPIRTLTSWVLTVAFAGALGCGREAPPEIHEYLPSAQAKASSTRPAEEPEDADEATAEATPTMEAPRPQPVAAAPPPAAVTAPPRPTTAAPSAAKAPTIVGTWRVQEMSRQGQPMPMPEGANMQFTFEQDGTMRMVMSMPGLPEPQTQQGNYTVNGDQITISMQRETKSGSLRFEGDSRAIIEVDEMRLTLSKN